MLKEISSKQEFLQETQSGVVIVDFYSQTCQPCKRLAVELDAIDKEYGDKVKIFKIDAYEAIELTDQYGVFSVPTVFKLIDGEVVDMFSGLQSKDFLVDWLGL